MEFSKEFIDRLFEEAAAQSETENECGYAQFCCRCIAKDAQCPSSRDQGGHSQTSDVCRKRNMPVRKVG